MILVGVSLVGALLFLWPFLGTDLPSSTMALAMALGTVVGLLGFEVAARRLDSRGLALMAALAAADAALRAVLVTGIGGFSPVFLLVLCGGYALGPTFGFLVGASSLLTSALATGGLGPWVPYELFALGWVGMLAGWAGLARQRHRPTWFDVTLLATVGVLAGFGYGAVMDIWNWTFFSGSAQTGWTPGLAPLAAAGRFGRYYLLTSLGYDAFRAGGNALMVGLTGLPILLGLRRIARRFRVEWEDAGGESATADHVAAGHLVVPRLAIGVHGGPQEAHPEREGIHQVPNRPEQAPAKPEPTAVLLANHPDARQPHARGAAERSPEGGQVDGGEERHQSFHVNREGHRTQPTHGDAEEQHVDPESPGPLPETSVGSPWEGAEATPEEGGGSRRGQVTQEPSQVS